MVFGFQARRSETSLRVQEATLRKQQVRLRMEQQDRLATLQFEAKSALLEKAKAALDANDLKLFNSLSKQAFGAENVGPSLDDSLGSSPGDTLTPHEKLLDGWRVVTTMALVLALFVVVALILLKSTATSTATPYVSLLSGLAGIALGWMFASAGGSNAAKRSRTRSSGSSATRGTINAPPG